MISLNQQQEEAVKYVKGPLLVLAGAGTGKTRVLTSRAAHIVASGIARPWEVLAVTFTNKAAKEIALRIANIYPEAQGVNVGTFHSIASKILRSQAEKLSLTSNFVIIDDDDQIKVIKNIMIELSMDIKEYPPKTILHTISRWKDIGLLPSEISTCDMVTKVDNVAIRIYSIYQERLLASNAVDFGDLLLYNNKLFLEHHDVLQFYGNRFKYVMIDEYQDTNPAQYIWARMLVCSHQNICCVGDDDQSIYSWRGADVTNILRFETDFPNAKLIKLEQNYRSTSQILAASSTLIQNNKARHNKTLWTSATGDPISIVSCYNDKIEAKFVVLQIRRAMVANIPDQTIAILVRAGFQTRLFEEELIFGCIAYTVVGGIKFYERMEIKDIIAYVRLAVNINDSLAFERIINVPKRAIGNVTLGHIKSFAIDNNCSLFSATEQMLKTGKFSAKTHNTLQLFVDQVISWNNCIKEHQPSKFAKKILEESGYRQMLLLEKTDESRARLDNIRELLSNMIEFENIDQFLEHASLVSNNDSNAIETPIVQLMTVHSAKGLEFDIVFMPGMEEGLFPHQKSLNEGHKALEEERRIAYVGITRAKKKLIMSYAENRFMFYEKVSFLPSRFISELPKDCYVFQKASSAYK